MKTLLIQIREEPRKVEWDRKNFLDSTGLKDEELKSINIIDGTFRSEDFDGHDAVIIGGSSFSIDDEVPNLAALKDFIKKAAKTNLPVLSIGFGAQLVAATLGGKVTNDVERQEFGTFDINKTEQGINDPLMEGMPNRFLAQSAHDARIILIPNGAVSLGKSARCPIHAYRIPGTRIYGLQFHPEFSKESFQEFLKYEIAEIPDDKKDLKEAPLKQILKSIKTTKTGIIIKNFLKFAGQK